MAAFIHSNQSSAPHNFDFTGATFADNPKPHATLDFTGARFADSGQPINRPAPQPQAAPAQPPQISAPNPQPDFTGALFAPDEPQPDAPPEAAKAPPPVLPAGAIPPMPKSSQGAANTAHLGKIIKDATIETT